LFIGKPGISVVSKSREVRKSSLRDLLRYSHITPPVILYASIALKGGKMARKTSSRTEKESFLGERLVGTDHHKTTISDGKDKAVGRGNTAKEAEKHASDRWDKKGK